MKTKGISIFELHIEKIVFAIFFIALLAVFGAQFFIPSTVKVGGQDVAPAKAGEIAAQKAQRKVSELESQQVNPEIPDQAPDLLAIYREKIRSTDASGDQAIASLGTARLNLEGLSASAPGTPDLEIEAGAQFAEFIPPATDRPVVSTFGGALDPFFVQEQEEENPGFKDRLGLSEQPFDVRGISVETAIDTSRLRSALVGLPSSWWLQRVEVLDVEILRQRLERDGSWGEAQVIAKAPMQGSLEKDVQNPDFSPADLRKLLDKESSNRMQIRVPRTLPQIAGTDWIAPMVMREREAELANVTAEDRQIERLRTQLESVRREIEDVRRRLDVDTSAVPATIYRAQRGGGSVGGGGGGRDGGSSGAGPIDAEKSRQEAQRKARERNQRNLDRLLEQETQIIQQIIELGGNPDGTVAVEPWDAEAYLPPADPLTTDTLEELKLWGHDYDAEPGNTYRYAVRYWVTNPFFGHVDDLAEEQKHFADRVGVVSEQSEWSDAIYFEPNVQFFLADARPAQRGQFTTGPAAELEVYRFYYGYWRKGETRVGAGEPIVANIELPEAIGVFETEANEEGGEPAMIELDTESIVASIDAYLVDVLAGVAGETSEVALIATPEGDVYSRSPDADQTARARESLLFSFQLGMAAGAPGIEDRPEPRREEDRESRPGRDGIGRDTFRQ